MARRMRLKRPEMRRSVASRLATSPIRHRGLSFERLEGRDLLSYVIAGDVLVKNFPLAAKDDHGQLLSVPVIGARVKAVLPDDATGRLQMKSVTTDEKGHYEFRGNADLSGEQTVTLSAQAFDPKSDALQFKVHRFSKQQLDMYATSASFDANGATSYVNDFNLDANDTKIDKKNEALAFTIFTIINVGYHYATDVLNAVFSNSLDINFPDDTQVASGRPVSHYDRNNIAIGYPSQVLRSPDSVLHEFGHYIEHQNGCLPNVGGVYDERVNQRTQASPSVVNDLTEQDAQLAFIEAWPDYFAVTAGNSRGKSLNIPAVSDESFGQFPIGINSGYGEDSQRSIAHILWYLERGGKFGGDVVNPLTAEGLFQKVKGHATLNELWKAVTNNATTTQTAILGRLFEENGVSPVAEGESVANRQFVFKLPRVRTGPILQRL